MAGASAADVRSILSLPNPSTPGPSQVRKAPNTTERSTPALTTQLAKPQLKQKPNLGGGGRVKWEWRPFKNDARSDSLKLSHWARAGTDPEAEYGFSKYNVQPVSFVYSQDDYARFLEDNEWTKEETDYLFDLVREYDLRWYIVHDRYGYADGPERTLEDLKDRYYTVCRRLVKNRPWAGDEAGKTQLLSSLQFDKDREVMRKNYIASLENRTELQKAEEDALYVELKRLEQSERRFKRDRDELLRTLLGIESGLSDLPIEDDGLAGGPFETKKKKKTHNATVEPETPVTPSASNVISLGPPQPKRAHTTKSVQYDNLHCIHRSEVPPSNGTTTKSTHQPVYLRSYKSPTAKTTPAAKVAQVFAELGISPTRLVMPTRDNYTQLESLMEAAAALVETKKAVDKVEQDIRVMNARLGQRDSEDGGETGDAVPTPMDVDEGNDGEAEADGRAQSVLVVQALTVPRIRSALTGHCWCMLSTLRFPRIRLTHECRTFTTTVLSPDRSIYISRSTDPYFNLSLEDCHVSGSAYKIVNNRAYHHGTMLISTRLDLLGDLLRVDKESMHTKGVASVRSPVRNLQHFNPLADHIQFVQAVVGAFRSEYQVDEELLNGPPALQIYYVEDNIESRSIEYIRNGIEELPGWNWVYGQTPEFTHTLQRPFASGSMTAKIHSKHGVLLSCTFTTDEDVDVPLKEKFKDLEVRLEQQRYGFLDDRILGQELAGTEEVLDVWRWLKAEMNC
ncbi:uncharacterized protein FIBRA_03825 [Fibroporia radiculosa]|uniref:SWR1-complex protein 4 n=1 Tax=Fibroporia radiculosa TaxID=599839 RepID=J4H2M0_9APHY|nr:uncharacterized protein FIBRA_03825 [Fibroporia radiculosa]CCM01759.1 predicted protein [Fibroporia radiculosa]